MKRESKVPVVRGVGHGVLCGTGAFLRVGPFACLIALGVFAGERITAQEAPVSPAAPVAAPSAEASTPPVEKPPVPTMSDISVPTPGELFEALDKNGNPAWAGQFRDPIPTSYPSRAQTALNIGGLVADGYIAVEAQASQQVKNVGRDIIALAKSLGVSQNVLARGNSISEFAENNEWSVLKEELEATQNEVKLAMHEQKDDDLVDLVTLGAWVRGTQVVTGSILKSYTPEAAKVLRQPALVAYLRSKITSFGPKLLDDPHVAILKNRLVKMEQLVSFPIDQAPTEAQVRELNVLATELVDEISKRQEK